MGTRSSIAIIQPDGKIKAIYCHSDGYPEYMGKVLSGFYDQAVHVNQLIDKGFHSYIASVHSRTQDNPDPPLVFDSKEKWIEEMTGYDCEFFYLFDPKAVYNKWQGWSDGSA